MYSVYNCLIKNRILTVRFSNDEYNDIEEAAYELDVSKAEIVRRLYWIIQILFSDNLMLRNVVLDQLEIEKQKRFLTTLQNIPELTTIMIEKRK